MASSIQPMPDPYREADKARTERARSDVHTSRVWDELTPGALGRLLLHGDSRVIAAALSEWTDGAPLTRTELVEALQSVAGEMIRGE